MEPAAKQPEQYPLGCDLVEDDTRNYAYHKIQEVGAVTALPAVIEVPAYQFNQRSIDSCVGQGVGNAKSVQEGEPKSTRFIWSLAKREQNYQGWGTNVPLTLKMLQEYGIPKLSTVPDDSTLPRDKYMKICDNVGAEVYVEAAEAKSLSYWYIYSNNQDLVSKALLEEGIPLITTMMWYTDYNRPDKDGFLPRPTPGNEAGGHCIILRRKERIGNRVKCTFRNSWSEKWGDNGDFHVWEDEIVSVYKMGTFFVIVDIPKPNAVILDKYNGQLVKNEDSPRVYLVWRKEIVWIENEDIFNFMKNKGWGDWNDIITIPEKTNGTKKFNFEDIIS